MQANSFEYKPCHTRFSTGSRGRQTIHRWTCQSGRRILSGCCLMVCRLNLFGYNLHYGIASIVIDGFQNVVTFGSCRALSHATNDVNHYSEGVFVCVCERPPSPPWTLVLLQSHGLSLSRHHFHPRETSVFNEQPEFGNASSQDMPLAQHFDF